MDVMTSIGKPVELVPQMRDIIACNQGFWLAVTGYSMTPTLRHLKDKVYIAPLNRKPARGDILLTAAGSHCLLHRVVKCGGGFLYYKGDAHKDCEGPLPLYDVIGIVTRIERNGRVADVTAFFHFKSFFWRKTARIFLFTKRIFRHFAALFRQLSL